MRCGHCQEDHETVAQVRACYGIVRELKHQGDSAWMSADGDPEGYGNPPSISIDPGATMGVAIRRGNPGKPGVATWTMPSGYYAIDGRDGRDTDFYRVDRLDTGKWSGWTFVKMVIGGKSATSVKSHDLLWPILEAIQADPDKAALRYGVELGRCSRCNVHLTDETSRRLGMGPDCRNKRNAA